MTGRRFVMWLDNQQVQKRVSGEFYASDFDLRAVSRLWWCTLVDCPEVAQTVLQLNICSCVQRHLSGHAPLRL